MFEIIKIIFFMIGVVVLLLFLCKLIFLIVLWIKRHGNPDKYWSIVKTSMVSQNCDSYWFLIPTIAIHFSGKAKCEYVEITIRVLKWEYYSSYELSNEV